jgi:MtrB/PioB family decaheme-associated outer membrane protein
MRTRTIILIGALLLASASLAQAQQAPPASTPSIGTVDFGFRTDSLMGDEARYNRFRDLRDGAYLTRFRFDRETETWFFKAEADNVGYRDQRYSASFANIGKLKASFEWNQIPLFISADTRTLYRDLGNGVLDIDDTIQQGLQAGTLSLSNALTQASRYDLRSKRSIGNFEMVYSVNRDVDLKFNLKNTLRNGSNLMSFGFGTSPGLNPLVELAVPTDDRTTDFSGSVEFANARGLLSVGYNGSVYDNSIPAVQFDNPLRAVSINNGPSVGQVVMWPNSTSIAFNVNGSYKLPARTRASAFVSVGRWNADEDLFPSTVNTALVAPPLPRSTTQAKANIVSMVYGLNSRPTRNLWLNAKYRFYDYDNKTPHFATTALVGDWTVGTAELENEPASMQRRNLDLDASFTPFNYVAFGVGYGREDADRTWRIFGKTAEDAFRVSVDSTGNQYVTLRAKFERSSREGSHFEVEHLEAASEQPDMRHFDIANRDRDRFTATVALTPVSQVGINASVGTGKDDFSDSYFGLRDNEHKTYSFGLDFVPTTTVSFGGSYGYEKYTALQWSRTASPNTTPNQFIDPNRDWFIDSDDEVKTFDLYVDLVKALPKTDIRLDFDVSDGNATYVYAVPNIALAVPAITAPVQLAPLKNKLTSGRADVQYFVRPNVAFGVAYWYEEYAVDDFAQNSVLINQLNPVNAATGAAANAIYSGYLNRHYKAHTGWIRLTYLW